MVAAVEVEVAATKRDVMIMIASSIARYSHFRVLLALLAPCFAPIAFAQNYPTKPVRLIVAFVPGGGADIVARQFTPKLSRDFGQSFVVDNRGGAGGSIGAEIAAKAAPDGYTLFCASGSYAANAALYKPAFDAVTGIAPIVEVGFSPFIVSVHPSVPAKSIQELIALARPKPGQLTYGSSGTGGITHLATELMASMAKIKMVHIPYKASSAALIDVIGGQVQLIVGSMLPTLPHVRAGKLRALAVTTAERWPTTPEIPTVAESLPGYDVELWFGFWAPKGTPQSIVNRLNASVNKALHEADIKQNLEAGGLRASGGTAQKFAERIRKDVKRWEKVVAEIGLKPD
jgi:tripartite-type tricarboxylate transporter receptor subunit TctC